MRQQGRWWESSSSAMQSWWCAAATPLHPPLAAPQHHNTSPTHAAPRVCASSFLPEPREGCRFQAREVDRRPPCVVVGAVLFVVSLALLLSRAFPPCLLRPHPRVRSLPRPARRAKRYGRELESRVTRTHTQRRTPLPPKRRAFPLRRPCSGPRPPPPPPPPTPTRPSPRRCSPRPRPPHPRASRCRRPGRVPPGSSV